MSADAPGLTRAAGIAALVIFAAFLVHNVNGLYVEPRYLGFASYTDYADLDKLMNASRATPWLLSGLGHLCSGFAMVVLAVWAEASLRAAYPVAARIAFAVGLLTSAGFLLLGLSHVIGRQSMAALNFEGNSAPFIQYAHARCCSLLEKAPAAGQWGESVLSAPEEAALARALGRYPEVVLDAAATRRPHLVAAFALECASALNQFYKACPVLKAESEALRDSRLALVDASRWVLRNCLTVLGITAPEEM